MPFTRRKDRPRRRKRLYAAEGAGPLLQRDYWAVIEACRVSPEQIGELLAARLCSLSPPALARFVRADRSEQTLHVGDDLDVILPFLGTVGVRVIDRGSNSITLGTLQGHPEAGRITFGAYRDRRGDVIFHIRSRARSSTTFRHAEHWAVGQSVQANAWAEFIERVANELGRGVADLVYEETHEVEEDASDASDEPTYLALGG